MCNGRHGSMVGTFIFPFGRRDIFRRTYDYVLILCTHWTASGHPNPARILTQRFTTRHNTSNRRHAEINYNTIHNDCRRHFLLLTPQLEEANGARKPVLNLDKILVRTDSYTSTSCMWIANSPVSFAVRTYDVRYYCSPRVCRAI